MGDWMLGRAWVIGLGVLVPLGAQAQPAQVPPGAGASFADAQGCRWQRVEIGDQVAWAAVIGADGVQDCDPAAAASAEITETVLPAPEEGPDSAGLAPGAGGAAPETVAETDLASDPEPTQKAAQAGPVEAPHDAKSPLAARSTPAPEAAAPAQSARKPVRSASWRKSQSRPVFPDPGFYLQVGAFAEPPNALRVIDQIHGAGFGALKQDFPHRRGGILRVLYAGPFASRSEAEAARRAMQGLGHSDAFIWAQK